MNLRWIVLKILDSMEFDGVFVNEAIDQQTKDLELTKQERGFIKKVVFGVIENRIYLDYVLNNFSKVKVRKMKPAIRHTLRLSAYQLIFMTNVPPSAVCNEAVKLIKKRKMYKLTGFVNGVLRSLIRELDHLKLPDKDKDALEYLSLKYSYEKPLIERLLVDYDITTVEELLLVSNEEAPLTIRVHKQNTTKDALVKALAQDNIFAKSTQWLKDALYIEGIDRIESIKAFQNGLFQVQDESSMLVALAGYDASVQKVIDVCSAPGGKAIHMADLMGDQGEIKAYDMNLRKIGLINENIERLGLKSISTAIGDGTVSDTSLLAWADVVIVDVPCSGLGIIRKKPDIKWHANAEKISELVVIQRDILNNVKDYVKVGGTMIYSTCTVVKEENQDNVSWFLEENDAFELVPIEGPYVNEVTGMVELLPMSKGPDGFFVAKMKRVK